MIGERITADEEHARLDAGQDQEAQAETFLVDFVRSKPVRAVVVASDADEALSKFRSGQVEEYDEDEFDSVSEVTGIMEESE